MKFDLIRPCGSCPFRSDVPPFLHPARAREIVHGLYQEDGTFGCHMTVDYDPNHDEAGDWEALDAEQHCAGAMILMERQGRANQMMRIAERLGSYDRARLDMNAPVFESAEAFIAHHAKS